MGQAARVHSIEAIQEFKDGVCVFRDESIEALGAVQMEIRRAFDFLEQQTRFWQNEVRRREELVLVAKNELTRKKMMPIIGKNPDTTEQEKNLKLARRRLEEAEEKLETARKLAPHLRREVDEYEGPARQLSNLLEADLANAVALLERKLDALEAYLALQAPAEPKAETAAPKEASEKEAP